MLSNSIKNKSNLLKGVSFVLLLFMYGCSTATQTQQIPVVDVQGYNQSPPDIISTDNTYVHKYTDDTANNHNNVSAITSYRKKSLQELSYKNINIPKKADGKPDYSKIAKGSYHEEAYYTKQGDTLFLISYLSGKSVDEIIRLNDMSEPYVLSPNKIIRLKDSKVATVNANEVDGKTPVVPIVKTIKHTDKAPQPIKNHIPNVVSVSNVTSGTWMWPTSGKVIQGFGKGDGGNKGIDIAGSKGQAVVAAASGNVVYAGRDLNGYGNLIILRHGDSFLSTYAHNDTILVKKDQRVTKGQKIATMGDTDADRNKLHFEIRRNGDTVDPLSYLPRR